MLIFLILSKMLICSFLILFISRFFKLVGWNGNIVKNVYIILVFELIDKIRILDVWIS